MTTYSKSFTLILDSHSNYETVQKKKNLKSELHLQGFTGWLDFSEKEKTKQNLEKN